MNGRWRVCPAAARIALAIVGVSGALFGSMSARERERVHESNERSGGDTTVCDDGPHAYGRVLANLDPLRWSEVRFGKQRFVQQWPRRGPSAIARACVDCHYRNGRGPRTASRASPAVFGLGLIEAIPDAAIVANADPQDLDRDGISGRAQRVRDPSTGSMVLGRFGWKAAQPSLAAQSTTALARELGVTASRSDSDVTALVNYLRARAVPARRRWTDPAVREGERLFSDIGCGTCHRPDIITTGQAPGWIELSGQAVRPYTDLLLHDMGPALADDVAEGIATGREWRTPPLWGLGLMPVVNGELRLLHDGRARSLEEAIRWHGGEAARARQRFLTLPRAKRDTLTTFLATL